MMDLNTMKENYDVIKGFCTKYRRELTIIGGVMGEQTLGVSCETYVEFMDTLSDEVFVGNYLAGLLNNFAVEWYKEILDGADLVDTLCGFYPKEMTEEIRKRIG